MPKNTKGFVVPPALATIIAQVTAEFVKFMIDIIRRRVEGEEIKDEELSFHIRGKSKQQLLYESAKAARGL